MLFFQERMHNRIFFRNIILSTLNNSYFDKYVLCSAFFQENKFSTSSEIISALNSTRTVNIDIYGLYRGTWNKQFNQFCSNLKNYYQTQVVQLIFINLSQIPMQKFL